MSVMCRGVRTVGNHATWEADWPATPPPSPRAAQTATWQATTPQEALTAASQQVAWVQQYLSPLNGGDLSLSLVDTSLTTVQLYLQRASEASHIEAACNAVAALLLLEGIDVQCSAGHSSAVHSAVLATAVANLSAAERRVLRRRTGRGCDVPHSRHSPWRRGNQAVAFASRGAQAFALASR